MDKQAVAYAIKTLREAGIRVPRSLTARVSAAAGYEPSARDLKSFEKTVTGLLPGEKLIVKLSASGRLRVFTEEHYQKLNETARKARAGKIVRKPEVLNGN